MVKLREEVVGAGDSLGDGEGVGKVSCVIVIFITGLKFPLWLIAAVSGCISISKPVT